MRNISNTQCCGVKELSMIQGKKIERVVNDLAVDIVENTRFGMVTFTTNERKTTGQGDKLMKFIIKNKLGEVTATRYFRNPNTGNMVRHYQWIFDRVALAKFSVEYDKKILKAYGRLIAPFKVGDSVRVKKEYKYGDGDRLVGKIIFERRDTSRVYVDYGANGKVPYRQAVGILEKVKETKCKTSKTISK